MLRRPWPSPRSTFLDFPKGNDPEPIRSHEWAGPVDNEAPRCSLLHRSSHFGYEGRKLQGIRRRRINLKWEVRKWCRGTELNCRHQPFQGCALPTELPRHDSGQGARGTVTESSEKNQAAWSVWFIWLIWSIWFISFNQTHETDRIDQMNKIGCGGEGGI